MPNTVTPSMPPNTAVPSVRRISAPAPSDKHQRHHAQNEGERCHHDRPQPQPAGGQRGVVPAHARLPPSAGKLDDQNRVLARQADQHHEADLRENIDIQMCDTAPRRSSTASTSARPKSPPAAATSFRTARPAPKTPAPRPARTPASPCCRSAIAAAPARSIRERIDQFRFLFDHVLHQVDRLAGTDRRIGAAVDRRRRIHVVAIDQHRAGDVANLGKRAERHHFAPVRLRTLSCFKSSICSRKSCSACTFTCQVRPNRLKSLTYSEPK